MDSIVHLLFKQARRAKVAIAFSFDMFFITISYWAALVLRVESIDVLLSLQYWLVLILMLMAGLLCFVSLGLYKVVLRYLGYHAIATMIFGVVLSALIMKTSTLYLNVPLPLSVPVMYCAFALVFCCGARSTVQAIFHHCDFKSKVPVVIYGAGSAGRKLNISLQGDSDYHAVAFVDDNTERQNTMLSGALVYKPSDIHELIERYKVKRILLAMPNITRKRRCEIVGRLKGVSVDILTVPSITDIVSGKAKLNELKELGVEELLGRNQVEPYQELIGANVVNKAVMVTGAGGSIGSELCRQILNQKPRLLVLLEYSEFALYQIDLELNSICKRLDFEIRVVPVLASVQHKKRVASAMRAFGVETVYHAAAFKHVPLVEYNVVEAVRNNVFGSWMTAEAAMECGVETFVLVSTDKAVRPTNVMGATKRLAELVLQGLATRQNETRFCMVRFGNVLGSSGSVVPLFKQQISNGGPVTLTHEEITRYFMTIPEAAQLVIQAGAMGKGGDVFVLDMGNPVRILDLARKMVDLMGYEVKDEEHPYGDIEIKITGLRPGEKLYEELLIGDDEQATVHPRIRTANEVSLCWEDMESLLQELDVACENYDQELVRKILLDAPAGFKPQDEICDLVWKENQVQNDSAEAIKDKEPEPKVKLVVG